MQRGAERDELILDLLPRCRAAVVRHVELYGQHFAFDEDDLMAWASIGAIRAVDAWQPGGMPLGPYAWYRITQTLVDEVRAVLGRNPKHPKVPIPFGFVPDSAERSSTYEDSGFDDALVDVTLSQLPVVGDPRHSRWLARVGQGEEMTAVARDDGVVVSTVSKAVTTLRLRLRPYRATILA